MQHLYQPPPPGGAIPRRNPYHVYGSLAAAALRHAYDANQRSRTPWEPGRLSTGQLHHFCAETKARNNLPLPGDLRLVRYSDGSAVLAKIAKKQPTLLCAEIFSVDDQPHTLAPWGARCGAVFPPAHTAQSSGLPLWVLAREAPHRGLLAPIPQALADVSAAMGSLAYRDLIPALMPDGTGTWALVGQYAHDSDRAPLWRATIAGLIAQGTLAPQSLIYTVSGYDGDIATAWRYALDNHWPLPKQVPLSSQHARLQAAGRGHALIAAAATLPRFWAPPS